MTETPTGSPLNAPDPGQALLTVRQLACERDGRQLFRNLNFAVHTGEIVQLQGSNGSGKTTLLRILCGLNDSYEGELVWRGQNMHEQREDFLSSLLYLGHRVGVNKVLSPLENLRWTCNLQHQTGDEQIIAALARLGLRGYEESPCYTLSAGQQQRVALARLLLSPSSLWVLDEPFTTLDVKGVRDLEELLAQHALKGGAALVTTHHKLSVRTGLNVINLDSPELQARP